MKQVKLTKQVNDKLNDIVLLRKSSGELIKTKQDVVADLIMKAHKRECK